MKEGKISAVIITKNEQQNIVRCLNSLKGVADEVIVVDSKSTDATKMLCLQHNVRFYEQNWQGYSYAKNFGNSLANYDYILSIDADEALSSELQASILAVKNELHGVYNFNRCLNYCGQWIRHSGWYPDKKIRLFPKNGSSWNKAAVHETIEFLPTTHTHLTGDLEHYSYYSIDEHIQRCNYYTTIAANKYVNKPQIVLYFKMIFSPIFRFIVSFFFKLGFLDGMNGFFICCMQSFDILLKYEKALQKKKMQGATRTSPQFITSQQWLEN